MCNCTHINYLKENVVCLKNWCLKENVFCLKNWCLKENVVWRTGAWKRTCFFHLYLLQQQSQLYLRHTAAIFKCLFFTGRQEYLRENAVFFLHLYLLQQESQLYLRHAAAILVSIFHRQARLHHFFSGEDQTRISHFHLEERTWFFGLGFADTSPR